jgi:alcohol dehydrogenase class IV
MPRFDFFNTPRILFGRGRIGEVGTLAKSFSARALLVYNGDDPGAGGPLDRASDVLLAAPVEIHLFRQRGEPQVKDVENAVAAARDAGCDVVSGLGGGSAIDCAKAVAGVHANGGSPLDYMEVIGQGKPITKPAAPWIAVPTTAGTGAEVTRNAVIGEPSKKFKASLRSELLLPRVALIDPDLGVGVPPDVTAASGMDALCQLIESYTSTGAQPMTDGLALQGLAAATSLADAYRNGADVDAREDMCLAALLSGICLTNAGLGAVHGFAAPLGANFPVPHGVVCAALLPHVVAANIQVLRARSPNHRVLERYDIIHNALRTFGGADLVSSLAGLVEDLRIPRLGQFGVTERHVPEMVALTRKASSMRFNPVVLPDDVLADVLRRAL